MYVHINVWNPCEGNDLEKFDASEWQDKRATSPVRAGDLSTMLLGPRTASSLHRSLSILLLRTQNKPQFPFVTRTCCIKQYYHPCHRTMSSLSQTKSEPFSIGAALRGRSGRTYSIQEVLSERRDPLLCVYRASDEGENFIVENMISGEFEYQQDLQKPLASCTNLRTVIDIIPDFELFVYHFLAVDLLQISQRPLSTETRRSILRSALTGLAELHDRGIVHTDIKPNNILLDYEETTGDDIAIKSVQISDLEDAVLLPPGKNLKGCLCGNQLWRSPESWARARQNTPSDMFSFGVVVIYVMLNDMIFRVSDEGLGGDDAWWHILRRHISYFGDEDCFKGLLQHIGEDNRPRKPFAMWHYVDAELRDLVMKMTNLDPARRIIAREALEHPWFRHADLRQKT
ncbi:kinase-like protein [Corynascus novoguineensis]|uniref:Kinase-like protein n=1 Tax=Corynascus novoguineensis TaxID=1126955 RepID=A0AAN7CR86_9PEZI|nr:kinase-like protein [Corynascus novoguineensis]